MKKHIQRNTLPANGQTIRFWVQIAFALLCIWIGVEFVAWYSAHSAGVAPRVQRPPGVEGFLPISALMSMWYLLQTGHFHLVHPAGLVILAAIIAISLLFKKSFCSWFCPVGTVSESIADFGKKLFGRTFLPWKWLDYPLRAIKYLLFGFLAYTVFFLMDHEALRAFLDSPYNKVADVKMYLFFAEISRTAIIVLAILVVLSMVIRNFWCRYLCPYGALLGIVGLFSPFRITRAADSCIDCAKCAKACPAAISVDTARAVLSDECTSCMACVDACPVADTLQLKASTASRFSVRPSWVAAGITAIFVAITGLAMLTGTWRTSVHEQEYARRIKDIRNPIYQHNHGSAPSEEHVDTITERAQP